MNILCFPLYYSEAIQKIKYKKKTSKETEKEEKIVAYIETINKREQKTFQPILDTTFFKFASNNQLKTSGLRQTVNLSLLYVASPATKVPAGYVMQLWEV